MTLRIAVIAQAMPGAAIGIARTLEQVVAGLRRRGHDVRPVVPEPAHGLAGLPADQAEAALSAHLERLGRDLSAWWSDWRPQLVYINLADDRGHVARDAAERLGLPVVATFQPLEIFADPAASQRMQQLLIAFHSRCQHTITTTRAYADWLAGRGVTQTTCIGHGADTVRFDPRHRSPALRASWGAVPAAPVLLFVSRLVMLKRLDLLVRTLEAARTARPATVAVIVGDGPDRAWLAKRVPWARFLGTLDGQELATAYASADLFLFPSAVDSWGHVVTEALASGVPVVACARGAALERVQDGICGRLVPTGDDDAFVAATVALLDDAARAGMARAARTAIAPFAWDGVVEQYAALFTSCALPDSSTPPAARPATAAPSPATPVAGGPLRVAFVTSGRTGEAAGAATASAALIAALRQHGCDIMHIAGDEVPPTGTGDPAQRLRDHLTRQVGEIANACRAWRPHLVHIEIAGVLGHAVLDLAQRAAVPVTSYWHALHRLAPSADQVALLSSLHAFHRRCARTFVDTPAQVADLTAAGVRDVRLIGRGVDAQHFIPTLRTPALRHAWGAGADTPVALYVSRLLEVKNLDLLARALEAARRARPQLIAVIVGDGPERAPLAARLPWAIFTGTLTGETLAEVYASADLFPYPGRTSSFALALLEAMASGLAPVAFAPAASLHLQDGGNGRVLADGDETGFIAAVATLASDLPLTRRLGAAARITATGIGWGALGALVAAEFRAVIAPAAAGATINAASSAPNDPAPRGTSDAPAPPPPSSAGTGRAPGQ